MKDNKLLVFDTETTGLMLHPDADPAKQPRLVEFAAMELSLANGAVLAEFNWLVNPGVPLMAEATKVHGITDEMVADAPSFTDKLPELQRILGSASSMCAHNLPFDRDIIWWELARAGFDPLRWEGWPPKGYCTINIFAPMWGRPPRLAELYQEIVGKEYAQTHRALDDVRALVEIIQKEFLWEIMR